MRGFLAKARRVLGNREMLKAYATWFASKALTARPPSHPIAKGVRVGEWISFSEYWTFSGWGGITEAEKAFGKNSLNERESSGVALDVGANIGIFTCFLASVGAKQVHSFEPIPDTFCRLKKNVLANKLVERCSLNCLAIGRGFDLVTFQVHVRSPGTNRIARSEEKPSQGGSLLQKVASVSLDRYCELAAIRQIDFLKIDVEGMECLVLDGGTGLFRDKRVRYGLIEVCPGNLHAAGFSPAALYDRVRDLGYQAFRLGPDGNPGTRLTAADFQEMNCENVVLLPK